MFRMTIWIIVKAAFLLGSFASASPPGSPQSQESSYGELIDNPHSEFYHQPHTSHTATSIDRSHSSQSQQSFKPKSRSPSPTLHQPTNKKNGPGYNRKSVIQQLLTDPSSDHYHYIKLLSPQEGELKDKKSKKRTSTQAFVRPSVETKSKQGKKQPKQLTDQEKMEKYEIRLLKMRTAMSKRRKEALSGGKAKAQQYLRDQNVAVNRWRRKKLAQDPNYFKKNVELRKLRKESEKTLGVQLPKRPRGRPRKPPVTSSSPTD